MRFDRVHQQRHGRNQRAQKALHCLIVPVFRHRAVHVGKLRVQPDALGDQLVVAQHRQHVFDLVKPAARDCVFPQPHGQRHQPPGQPGLFHAHQRIAALDIVHIRHTQRRDFVRVHQVLRGKERVLRENLVVRRKAQAVFLDHAAAIELAPRLLTVPVRHPVPVKIIGEAEPVHIDRFAFKAQIRPLRLSVHNQRIVVEHLLRAGLVRRADGFLQPLRRDVIVRIDERDILAPRDLQPRVARGGQAAVLLVNLADAAVPLRIRLHDRRAAVLRAVVDQDQLEIIKRLREDAVQAPGQIRLHLIDRHDHAHAAHPNTLLTHRYTIIQIDYTIRYKRVARASPGRKAAAN